MVTGSAVSRSPTAHVPDRRERGQEFLRSLIVGMALLIIATVVIGMAGGLLEGRLLDTDAYSWSARVLDLRADGEWFDDTLDRVDPPDGHTQHWSRPFDLLLLGGAVLGAPLLGFERALLWWAIVVPVALGLATLLAIWHGFRDLLDDAGRTALAFVVGLQPMLAWGFAAGRADHQALLSLALVVTVAAMRRVVGAQGTSNQALATGALAALGLWVGMEFLIAIAGVTLAVSLQWIHRRDHSLDRLMRFALGLALGGTAALLVERGPGALRAVELDELSLVYIGAAVLLALGCKAVQVVGQATNLLERGAAWRAIVLTSTGALTGAILLLAFPQLTGGPLGGVDPLYRSVRLAQLPELQSLGSGGLARVVLALNLAPLALLGSLDAHRRRTLIDRGWHLLAVPALLYLPLAITQVRWVLPLLLLLTVPAARGIQMLMHAMRPQSIRVDLVMGGVAVIAGLWWLPVQMMAETKPTLPRC